MGMIVLVCQQTERKHPVACSYAISSWLLLQCWGMHFWQSSLSIHLSLWDMVGFAAAGESNTDVCVIFLTFQVRWSNGWPLVKLQKHLVKLWWHHSQPVKSNTLLWKPRKEQDITYFSGDASRILTCICQVWAHQQCTLSGCRLQDRKPRVEPFPQAPRQY